MLNVDPSILLAKKANRFGFFSLKNRFDPKSSQEFFMKTLLQWANRLSFDGRLLLENEGFKKAFKRANQNQKSMLSNKLYLSPDFFMNLDLEDISELDVDIDNSGFQAMLETMQLFDIRFVDSMGLDNFLAQLSYLYTLLDDPLCYGLPSGIPDWFSSTVVSQQRSNKLREALYPDSYKKGVKPSLLIQVPPLKGFWQKLKENQILLLKQAFARASRSIYKKQDLATRQLMESKGFNKSFFIPKLASKREFVNTYQLDESCRRAFYEHLLLGKRSPEIMSLVPQMVTLKDGGKKTETFWLFKEFIHRLNEPRLVEACYEKVEADVKFRLLLIERLLELDYLGEKMPNYIYNTYATQYAWLDLKKKLDPDRYSNERLRKDKKLLKRISECGHSSYVISLYERGLISRPPRTMTAKLAIYFARKGLIKSYNEIPSLKIKEYFEVEFTLLKDGILLDDLRPIHLSQNPIDFSALVILVEDEKFTDLMIDERLRKRFLRSYKLFKMNASLEDIPENFPVENRFSDSRTIRSLDYEIKRALSGTSKGSREINYSDPDFFFEELEKALSGKNYQEAANLWLNEETIPRILEAINDWYEKSNGTNREEIKLTLYRGLYLSLDGYLGSGNKPSATKLLNLDCLMSREIFSEFVRTDYTIGSLNELLKCLDPLDLKDLVLFRLVVNYDSDFLIFLHEHKLKLYGLTAEEIVKREILETSENSYKGGYVPYLGSILYDMGLSKEDILKLHDIKLQEGFSDDSLITCLLDPKEKHNYKTRVNIAYFNPKRKVLNNDKSKAVIDALAEIGALEGPKLYSYANNGSNLLFNLNLIRNGSDQDLLNYFEMRPECSSYVLELVLRKEEKARRLIAKLPRKEIRFKRRSIKNDPISKFIRSSMGKGRV